MSALFCLDAPVSCDRVADRLVLVVSRDGADHPALAQHPIPVCEPGILAIDVDLAQVAQANSVLIGWLVRLVSQCGRPVRLIHAAPRVALLLRRMNLHALMTIA